jgi:hypothetical protein
MRVKELVPDSKVIWYVEDSLIALPELKNQTEWIGTTIVWEIAKEEITRIKVIHIGLNPEVECYEICSNGWVQFVNSLKLFWKQEKEVLIKRNSFTYYINLTGFHLLFSK